MTPEVVLPSMQTSTHMRVHPYTNIHKYAQTKREWVFQNIAKIFFILSFYLCFTHYDRCICAIYCASISCVYFLFDPQIVFVWLTGILKSRILILWPSHWQSRYLLIFWSRRLVLYLFLLRVRINAC